MIRVQRSLLVLLMIQFLLIQGLEQPAAALQPTPFPAADLDTNGLIDFRDLVVFQHAWMGSTGPTPTHTPDGPTDTPTITRTPTSTRTPTPTVTLTPTIDLNGRLFGFVIDSQTSNPVPFFQLTLDLPDPYPDSNAFSAINGLYEFTTLPVGVSATIKNLADPLTSGYMAFSIPVIILLEKEMDISLVPLPTSTPTGTETGTPTFTPSSTITLSPTLTSTRTITLTPTITETPTISPTYTNTSTNTPSFTHTPTHTRTNTTTPTITRTPTPTQVNLAGTDWIGSVTLNNPNEVTGLELHGLSASNAEVRIKLKTFINTNVPIIQGTTFTFEDNNDQAGTGASIAMSGTITNQGNRIEGTLQFQNSPAQPLRSGPFVLNRQ